jgi:hypothetical protein
MIERARIALQIEFLSSNQATSLAAGAATDGRAIAGLPKPLYILASGVGGLGSAAPASPLSER